MSSDEIDEISDVNISFGYHFLLNFSVQKDFLF